MQTQYYNYWNIEYYLCLWDLKIYQKHIVCKDIYQILANALNIYIFISQTLQKYEKICFRNKK